MKILSKATLCILLITGLILVFLLFGGCSKTVEPPNTFTELLNLIPADTASWEQPVYFTLIDFASFYKDNDITFTNFEELTEEIKTKPRETLMSMPGPGSFITGYSSYAQHSTIREKYVGYDIGDIDAEIQFGTPPIDAVAAIGRFDPQATQDALSYQDEWPAWAQDSYVSEDYRGITIHSWGDGMQTHLKTRLVPPHIDMLGRARPLAVSDGYLFYAPSVSTVKSMIDSSQDETDSLANVPEFALVADGLSDLGAYAAIIGDESLANGDPEYAESYSGPRLKRFVVFGSGTAKDEKGVYVAIALVHENSDDAAENVSLLMERIENTTSTLTGKPWTEIITDTQINVEGKVLLVKLYIDEPNIEKMNFWWSWVYAQNTLLLHEQE